jgi:hypothetical protein
MFISIFELDVNPAVPSARFDNSRPSGLEGLGEVSSFSVALLVACSCRRVVVRVSISFLLLLIWSITFIGSDMTSLFVPNVPPFHKITPNIWLFDLVEDKSWNIGDLLVGVRLVFVVSCISPARLSFRRFVRA